MSDAGGSGPDWLSRRLCFYFAEGEHRRLAKRLRWKTSMKGRPEDLREQARRQLNNEMGRFPSEEPHRWEDDPEEAAQLEHSMRQMQEDILESIEETESYAWGLSIAGMYHLWERETRKVLATLSDLTAEKIEASPFKSLCKFVGQKTFYRVEKSRHFLALETCCGIANTIKHGEGSACRRLRIARPALFTVVRGSSVLRVGVKDFDEAAAAIEGYWNEYERDYDIATSGSAGR